LQCEVLEDGITILKSSTSGAIGRSILGGILGGGIGAIIGGTTGSKTQNQRIENIDLKIIINDTESPVYRINFLSLTTRKGSFLYKIAFKEAEKWHGILSGFIRQGNDAESNKTNNGNKFLIADELTKLKELLDQKILTEKEFDDHKSKLLGY